MSTRPLRLLFIHAALQAAAEYSVHRTLAEHVDVTAVVPYFIWQDNTHDQTRNRPAKLARPEQNIFYDFGRNMDLVPKPSRSIRAALMMRQLPGALRLLHQEIRRVRPDAIYTSQQQYDVALGSLLSKIIGIPHIIHIHYPVGHWLGQHVLATIRRSKHLVAVSQFIRQTVITAGVAPEYVRVRHETVSLKQYDQPGDRNSLRRVFGWPTETPLVVAAGRLDPSKGHMLLLEAFAQAFNELPEARLLICGGTTQRDGYDQVLRQRAEALNIARAVVFAGQRDDMPAIFAGADLFALPTINDACPLVFLEAMASGLPVVAVRSGGVPEMVVDGETGLLAEPGDAAGLAVRITALLSNPSRAHDMGQAGRQRAFAVFAPERAASEWADLLTEILPQPRPTQKLLMQR